MTGEGYPGGSSVYRAPGSYEYAVMGGDGDVMMMSSQEVARAARNSSQYGSELGHDPAAGHHHQGYL
jgi:hypothetical protein